MKISKEAQLFINKCHRGDQPISCNPLLGVKYTFNDVEVKFTEELLEEILASGKVKILYRNAKVVNLTGAKL